MTKLAFPHLHTKILQFGFDGIWQISQLGPPSRVCSILVALHFVNCRLNHVQKLQSELYPGARSGLPISRSSRFALQGTCPRRSIEELPRCQDSQKCDRVFVVETLKSVNATSQENKVIERLWVRIRLDLFVRDVACTERAPIVEERDEVAACICEFTGNSMGELLRDLAMFISAFFPLSLLNVLSFCALSGDRIISSSPLRARRPQCNHHCDKRDQRRSQATECSHPGPIRITRDTQFKARSQVAKLCQRSIPQWTGWNSAMSVNRTQGGSMFEANQAKHAARVYLNEARTRRSTPFFWKLIAWAGNARRRATPQTAAPTIQPPAQLDLFA